MSDIKTYIEHWKRLEDLPGGGQGTTIKAINSKDNITIAAVKILNKQNDNERRSRMLRETVNLSTLSHSNLPNVLDTNTEHWQDKNYKLFIATEFISGSTLSSFDFTNIPLKEKVGLTIKICEVINYCHQRGVIHRDIKPDNIILRDNSFETPIVIDFGLSFNFDDNDDDNLTSLGQHLGNRFLILPEQKVGEVGKRDFRSDISCIVGLLYYFITNNLPTIIIDEYNQKPHQRLDAKNLIEKFPQHQRDILNFIFDIGFNQLIDKRWQTAQSLIDQLYILQKSEPIKMKTTGDILNNIKQRVALQDFEELKNVRQLFANIKRLAEEVLTEIRRDLGDDWGYTQVGGPTFKEPILKLNIFPSHTLNESLRTNTIIDAFITGNELVIQVSEKGEERQEVFRQPILNLNWKQFKDRLKTHYLTELSKVI